MNGRNGSTAVEIDHDTLDQLIKVYYKKGLALFIWGATGIGKSHQVRESAKSLAKALELEYSDDIHELNDPKKFVVVDVRLSQLDPSDLRGIPVWDKEKHATVWLPPDSLPRSGRGVIFFDELNLSPPLVQASAYQMILDRRLGTYVVPEGYMMIGAGNRLEDRANVFEMASPLKNRFGHCQLNIPNVDDWTDWAVKNEIDIRIIGYLQVKRSSLFGFDPKLKENAFPTPRSWEHCSVLIKDLDSHKDLEMIQLLASTKVGVGTAGELGAFIRIKDKLRPIEDYLKDPDKVKLPDEKAGEQDVLWAFITSLAEYYQGHKDSKTLEKAIKLLKRLSEEYAVFTLKLMVSVDKQLTNKIIKIPEAAQLAKKLIDFFEP